MTKQNKSFIIRFFISLFVGFLIYYIFGYKLYLSSNLISNAVTFLSIIFGFYITSFSIFTTSRYVANLYKIDDAENSRQSLMDTLIHKYKIGLVSTLFSILYVIIIFFILGDSEEILLTSNWYLSFFLPIILFDFIYSFEMMNILIKVIKQTAKLNKE